jgi:hypothetical protein
MAWMAAVLASRGTAVLGFVSTLRAYGFRGFPSGEAIHVVGKGPRVRQPGIAAHRTRWLPNADRTRVRLIPTTTAERAFIDCCGLIGADDLGEAGDDALRRGLLRLPRLVSTFDRAPLPGRRKTVPMRGFLSARIQGFDPGGSEPELDVRRTIERAGYPLPVQQFVVIAERRKYKLDHAWPETKHCIEFDGYWAHGQYTSFHGDRARTRRLTRAGWTVWPVTSQTTSNEIIAIAVIATRPSGQ